MTKQRLTRYQYKAYMRSSDWQETRQRYARSRLLKSCYCCGADNNPLDLHHKTYKTLGHENLNHLCRVCRSCHEAIHALVKEKGVSIWWATKRIRSRKRRSQKLRVRKASRKKIQQDAIAMKERRARSCVSCPIRSASRIDNRSML